MVEEDGGPAFPGFGQVFTTDAQGRTGPQNMWGLDGDKGMSLRDYFAGQVLMGELAGQHEGALYNLDKDGPYLAKRSYAVADAMLAEREKK